MRIQKLPDMNIRQCADSWHRHGIELFEVSWSAVFYLLEYSVEGSKALEAGAHSYLCYGDIRVKQEIFSSSCAACVDVLQVGHRVVLLEDA